MEKQMELFDEGGLRDEGGEIEPKSGNEVPSGSLKKEVADDIPVMISEGEFVFPADVVRYIGLNTLMKMRQDAKQGLKMMEKMGQMGNPEEAELPDDIPFGMADLIVVSSEMEKEDKEKKAEGGVVELQRGSLIDPIDEIGGFGDLPEDSPLRDPRFVDVFPKDRFRDDPVLREPRALPIEDEPRGGGGLFDDPRFRDQKGREVPTLTDEDKKEIEDKLLGTVYGNITMKRYVDADGNVKYIPFIDDQPQMPIPDGYTLDDSAPTPKSSVTTTIGDSGDETDDSGGTTFTPDIRSPFADQGTSLFNINKLNAKELVDYYGSFSSPINRFLPVGVGALFGGVPALGIAAMQQLAQNRGPNSLKATEDLIAQKIRSGEISGDLLEQLKKFQKRALEKGTAPKSFLASLINKVSGKDEQKKSNLQNAINTGKVSTISAETKDLVESSVQDALMSSLFTITDDFDSKEEGANELPAPIYQSITAFLDDEKRSTELRPQTLGVPASPEAKERSRVQNEARAMVEDIDKQVFGQGLDVPSEEFALDMKELRGAVGTEAFKRQFRDPIKGSPYETEGRLQLGTTTPESQLKEGRREAERFDREKRRLDREKEQDPRETTKKRTRKADQPKTGILPRRGERFTDVGLDRPSKLGQTRVDDFLLGVKRDDKGNITNLTKQQQKNIKQNVQRQEDIRQKLDQEDRERQSRGFGPMGVQERFERQQQEFTGFDSSGNFVGFYVGGVPTKPMKPQRLKQGGLAKMKVKPKRMKKGGLASRKK